MRRAVAYLERKGVAMAESSNDFDSTDHQGGMWWPQVLPGNAVTVKFTFWPGCTLPMSASLTDALTCGVLRSLRVMNALLVEEVVAEEEPPVRPEMAIAVAKAANARRLALYHHDPNHDDDMLDAIGREAKAQFPKAFVASEGLSVEL